MARRANIEQHSVALEAIRALVRTLHQSARAVERGTGVTNAQVFILRQLAEVDGLSINELADCALTGQNTVSTIVARLARHRLISRGRATDDRRRAVVRLTPAGRRLLQRAPEPPTARLLAALAAMPPVAASELGRGVKALMRAMGLSETPAGMLFEQDARGTASGDGSRARPRPAPATNEPTSRRPNARQKESRRHLPAKRSA